MSPSSYKKIELQKIHACIEVKILNENEKLKCRQKKLEETILERGTRISVIPTTPDEKKEQKFLNKKLKYIRALRTEFRI